MELKNILLDSCVEMHKLSIHCTNDYLVHNSSVATHATSCNWYHSVWQYLRILDCVSAPQWHQDFYEQNIIKCIQNKSNVSILISGSADYSLLHLIYLAVTSRNIHVEIDVVDLCSTPIGICKWYLDFLARNGMANPNIIVRLYRSNITMFSLGKTYDIICTDAFLTRFSSSETRSIIEKWERLLTPFGVVITTVRIHPEECYITPSIAQRSKDCEAFLSKVRYRYLNLTNDERDKMSISLEELTFMAFRYILRMKSNILGQKPDIDELFTDANLHIDDNLSCISDVDGEIKKTQYYRVVARKEK